MSFPAVTLGKAEAAPAACRPPLLPWIQLAVLAFLSQIAVIYAVGSVDREGAIVAVLLPAAHLLLLPFLVRNFSMWGMRLVAVGLLLNVTAMAFNGGLMPVGPEGIEAVGRHEVESLTPGAYIPGTKNVYLDQSETRLSELSDAIILPVPQPFTRAISIGDVFVVLGLATVSVEIAVRYRRWPIG